MSVNYVKLQITEKIRVDLFSATSFRVRYSDLEGEKFPEEYEIPFSMSANIKVENNINYKIDENNTFLITTDSLRILVKENFRVIVEDLSGNRIYPKIGTPHGMFLNHCIVYDAANFHKQHTDSSRFSHWFYNEKTGLYDINLSEDKIYDLFFIYADTYKEGYKVFSNLVGVEPMLNKKCFGYFQTNHYTTNGSQELLMKTAETFREKDIPCDTIVLDYEWGDGVTDGKQLKWGERLEWSTDFCKPLTPSKMISKLKEMNFDVMLIHHSLPDYEGRDNESWVSVPTDENLWWQKMSDLVADGVAGTWQDTRQTSISDHRIFNGLQKLYGDYRFLFLSNYEMYQECNWTTEDFGEPIWQKIGCRRSPFFWTGDMNYDKWAELEYQIEAITNRHGALQGVSYITNDAMLMGGRELGIRSIQFLCFNSIVRGHNTKPWQKYVNKEELANTMAITNDDGSSCVTQGLSIDKLLSLDCQDEVMESVIKQYLKLRYRLIPYIYTYARKVYDEGLPITRPMMVEFENDKNCNDNQWKLQYMFGSEILVSPVCNNKPAKEVYLPKECEWIDFFTGKPVENGVIKVDTSDLEKMPIFIKKGAIIPMSEEKKWLSFGGEKTLYLYIYPDKLSEFELYEDDGSTYSYRRGEFGITKISYNAQTKELIIGKTNGEFQGKVEKREIIVNLIDNGIKTFKYMCKTNEETVVKLI